MRILHVCLSSYYVDGHGYQENIIPKFHKLSGNKVEILASTETWRDNSYLGHVSSGSYINEDGIQVTRLPYVKYIPRPIVSKLRLYSGLSSVLERFKPELIYIHDLQFYNVVEIVKYKIKNNIVLVADSHTDLLNSATNWISMNILHKIVYKYYVQKIWPHCKMIWGTLSTRAEFYNQIYGVPLPYLGLLPLGLDDSLTNLEKLKDTGRQKRRDLGIGDTSIIVITGGKIDKNKNIGILLDYFSKLEGSQASLLVFGQIVDELLDEYTQLIKMNPNIKYLGWLSQSEIIELLCAADLAVYPGGHSVLWEQSVACQLALLVKDCPGTGHLDIGGNIDVFDGSFDELKTKLDSLVLGNGLSEMSRNAKCERSSRFYYSKIAKDAIS